MKFQLIRKTDNQAEYINTIDEQVCNHFGVEVSDIKYGGGQYNWFDTVCFNATCNNWKLDSKELREKMEWYDDGMREEDKFHVKMLEFLSEHYTINIKHQS